MSATRREGPTFLAWLTGRFTYPPVHARCSTCGRPGADPEVAWELKRGGMNEAARFATLCDDCRRKVRDRRIQLALDD
jgi:hypothetical protein